VTGMIRMVQQPLDFSSSSSASASEAAPSFAGSVTWEEIACGQRKMSMHGRWLQKRNQTAPIVQGSSLENVSILLLTHRLGQHQCQLNYLVGEYSNVLKLQLRELSTKRRGDARRQVSAFKTSCCRSRLAETILAEEH
jgi:hypothetical protein